jgi:hypothetical protein
VHFRTESTPESTSQTDLRGALLQQLEEEAVRNPDAPWETPSPAPDLSIERMLGSDHLMPFSPPTRAHNPMIQNSPFQGSPFSPTTKSVQLKEGATRSEETADGKVTSPREGLRRRRLRSLSCPEPDSNLVVGEA